MNNLDFLKHILGDQGYYCIVGLKKDSDRPVQKFFPTLEQAATAAENLVQEKFDAYYALATFEDGKSRKVVNVKQLKSLYLDLDCGDGKPYADQAEAADALNKFCSTVGLPSPTMVNSGGGLHAYWVLTEPISRDEWAPLAEKLKYLCDEHDLFADPAVTADPARILRVPGTFNYKNETPRPVEIMGELAAQVTCNTLKDIIGEPLLVRKSYLPKGEMDEVTKALLGNAVSRFKNIIQKTLKGTGCQQIRYICENQATMPEPMWRAGLSIAKFCEDADVAVQKISSGHPQYDPEETDRKVRGIKGGPYTCAKFEEYNPGGCAGCPHLGVIKSPIVLGREILEATEEDNIVEDVPENVQVTHTQTYVIPEYPNPYFRAKVGGIYKRIIKEGDEVDQLIYHNDMYVTRRLVDKEAGEAIVIRLHLPVDGVREFTVPLTAVTSKDEVRKHLSSNGVAVVKADDLQYYLTTWVNHMQMTSKAELARRQFGWTNDKFEAFVIGDKEVRADRVDHNPPSTATEQMFPAFVTKGNFDVWKEAMSFYERPGMELHQFVIGTLIGSIFTKMTPIHGAILSLYSTESGVGKTTTQIAGLSVWGDPSLLMSKQNDTLASIMNRVQVGNNLPVVVDEMSNASPQEASTLAYTISSGMQRNRMSSSSNHERTRGDPWNSTTVISSNKSIIEKISMWRAIPKGEAMRVLELHVRPVELDKEITDKLSKQLMDNYGHAYLPLLQFIMSDIEGVKALYGKVQKAMDQLCEFGPAERFYSVLVANAMMGIVIGNKLGFFNYDTIKLKKWVVETIRGVNERFKHMEVDAENLLVQFVLDNYNNILRINSTEDNRGSKGEILNHLMLPEAQPRMQFVIRHEPDVNMLYIQLSSLKSWCSERQINFEGFLDSLKRGRAKATIAKKRMSKGTKLNLPAVPVLWVHSAEFFDEDQIAQEAEHKAALEGTAP